MTAANPLAPLSRGVESPSTGFVDIVPHDANELATVVCAIYVGTGAAWILTESLWVVWLAL